jgi:hypothetical protein
VSHSPTAGDCLIAFCLSNQGLPSIADSLSGTWSSVYNIGGPTGGSRNYSLYMAYQPNVPSSAARTITWTGGASGQITGAACHIGGLASVTPYDVNATPPWGSGNSTALSSNNTSNATTYANEIVFGIGSVDTSTAVTWTYGNVAGVAATTTSMTSGADGSSPNILVEYNIVTAQGTYNATASETVSAHWLMQVVSFADTNVSPAATYLPYSQTQFFAQDVVSVF